MTITISHWWIVALAIPMLLFLTCLLGLWTEGFIKGWRESARHQRKLDARRRSRPKQAANSNDDELADVIPLFSHREEDPA